jgi:hypothetical protein
MRDPVGVGIMVFAAIGFGGYIAAIVGDLIGHAVGVPLLARGAAPLETFVGLGLAAGIAAGVWVHYRK